MIKKLTLSLLLVTLGLTQVNVFAEPTQTATTEKKSWSDSLHSFFWSTNTRKAMTIGGGLTTLVGTYLLWQKFSTKPEAGTPTTGAKDDTTEDVTIVGEKPADKPAEKSVEVITPVALPATLPAGVTPAMAKEDAAARHQRSMVKRSTVRPAVNRTVWAK